MCIHCMYIYVYMYIHVYTWMYIYCMYIYVYICIYVHVCIYMHVMYVYTCMYIYAYMNAVPWCVTPFAKKKKKKPHPLNKTRQPNTSRTYNVAHERHFAFFGHMSHHRIHMSYICHIIIYICRSRATFCVFWNTRSATKQEHKVSNKKESFTKKTCTKNKKAI